MQFCNPLILAQTRILILISSHFVSIFRIILKVVKLALMKRFKAMPARAISLWYNVWVNNPRSRRKKCTKTKTKLVWPTFEFCSSRSLAFLMVPAVWFYIMHSSLGLRFRCNCVSDRLFPAGPVFILRLLGAFRCLRPPPWTRLTSTLDFIKISGSPLGSSARIKATRW